MSDNTKLTLNHLGNIFLRMSIFCMCIFTSLLVAQVFKVALILLVTALDLIIVVGSVGFALISESVRYFIKNSFNFILGSGFDNILKVVMSHIPLVSVITGLTIGLAILFLSFNASKNKYTIIGLSVLMVIFIVVAIIVSSFVV